VWTAFSLFYSRARIYVTNLSLFSSISVEPPEEEEEEEED
jgi:hypothetical protein